MQKWNWPHSRGWTGITIDDCWKGWAILLRQKQKKLIMLPSETMIWQPEFTDKTLSRKPGAVQLPELLEPLYDILRQYVLMPGKVHADDIPVPVQEPGSGKTRTARLWVYVRDDRNASSEIAA
ncbi:Transposase (plasmid) [Shigella dysenteriae WRSd3]|uniref:Transposase n=1 Tax=Shigella dysenteriae WRSd3 TaxID=1401327 RepID=A0A090N984_SHIDY|nr:Transposase [Shigella dysenteriae WRSd3]